MEKHKKKMHEEQETGNEYVDGFVMVVPEQNMSAYREMAKMGAEIYKNGALEYFECIGDDLAPNDRNHLPKDDESQGRRNGCILLHFFKSRAHRDEVNAKVMQDPWMNDPKYRDKPMPFDAKRMAYGGFKVIVEG